MDDDPEPEGYEVHTFEINPEMIWGARISPEEVRVYICETQVLTFSNAAALAIIRALIGVMETPYDLPPAG